MSYDKTTLKHLQNLEKMILKDFIYIYHEHKLNYFLNSGSLLGIIRYHNFIQGDNHIDVIMFSKSHEKFVKYLKLLNKTNMNF